MAKREQFKQTTMESRKRSFSEEFKIKKVREVEQKITTVTEISRQYEVRRSCVYRWLEQYGNHKKGVKIIVESESDTRQILELKAKIAALEQIIGQKQVQLDFKDKMIELAEETYGVDIKKKFVSIPLSGSGNTGNC